MHLNCKHQSEYRAILVAKTMAVILIAISAFGLIFFPPDKFDSESKLFESDQSVSTYVFP